MNRKLALTPAGAQYSVMLPAMNDLFAPLVLIPVYDHEHAIGDVVRRVLASGQRCLLVDDGSHAACAAVLDELTKLPAVHLLRLPRNLGKGGAVMAGFHEAARLGATHVLQIDADGQHDADDIPAFINDAQHNPDAVICGIPRYDQSIPKSRLYGRYLTHVWVWINTLSLTVSDTMCGFRVYPLAMALKLIDEEPVGNRKDFDTENLVRLYWRGGRIIQSKTRVTYPADGVSHFDVWRDNLRISHMHARLFFGMLRRAPWLLARRFCGSAK
jgi:glycosyltransferase involved in cell wall biosynthesis